MGKQKEEEEKKDQATILLAERKKAIYNLVLLIVAAFVVLIGVLTMAWFTNNTKVNGTNMNVTIASTNFEIATSGTRIRYESMFPIADNTYSSGMEKTNGTIVLPDGSEESLASYYVTDIVNSHQSLMLKFEGTEYEATKSELEPGGSGAFKFYIIPLADGDLEIELQLNIRGFAEQTVKVGNAQQTQLFDISTLTTQMGYDLSQIEEKEEALRYLNGHIFFFEELGNPDDTSSPYYYKKPIIDGTLKKSISNAEAGKLYPITIYWMWPKTLGQITLKNNAASNRSGIPIVEDGEYVVESMRTDKGKVVDIVKSKHANSGFFDSSETITSDMIENSSENFKILSRGYNNADEVIGTHIRYMLLEICVY